VTDLVERSPCKVVILCGGTGMRMREETELRPKALVEIGGQPILWHIMKHYSRYGYRDFVLALGYKGEMIADYFESWFRLSCDYTLTLDGRGDRIFHHEPGGDEAGWRITFAWTGRETMTGGRIARAGRHIREDIFLATYGDGVSDVPIPRVVDFHRATGRAATLVGVPLPSPFGVVEAEGATVTEFREKPILGGRINGGFFVFGREALAYFGGDDEELDRPLNRLVERRQLAIYPHDGFWKSMDTYKDVVDLNRMWAAGDAPWRTWSDAPPSVETHRLDPALLRPRRAGDHPALAAGV
jgi:glucose-1-phosphate cytidylyltransferase